MVDASRQSIMTRFTSVRAEYMSLAELAGKNRTVAQAMLSRLENERGIYIASLERYRAALAELNQHGGALLRNLSDEALERLMNTDRKSIEDAWTTAGLFKSMQGLFDHFTAQAESILKFSKEILCLVQSTYAHFHGKAGFAQLSPPSLNLEQHTLAMHQLRQATIEYCHHPKQVLTEKHWLVPNFYEIMVGEARQLFLETREDTEAWLKMALNPLNAALKEHETQLNARIENLRKLQHNLSSVANRSKELEQQLFTLKEQHEVLLRIKTAMGTEATGTAPAADIPALRSANDPMANPAAQAA